MEEQEILKTGIGNIEAEKLAEGKVVIAGLKIKEVEKDGKVVGKKVDFLCKHPDKEEPIHISNLEFIKGKKVENCGAWVNLDKEKNLQKGSALAVLLGFLNAKSLSEAEGKEVMAVNDERGYLCLKAH